MNPNSQLHEISILLGSNGGFEPMVVTGHSHPLALPHCEEWQTGKPVK